MYYGITQSGRPTGRLDVFIIYQHVHSVMYGQSGKREVRRAEVEVERIYMYAVEKQHALAQSLKTSMKQLQNTLLESLSRRRSRGKKEGHFKRECPKLKREGTFKQARVGEGGRPSIRDKYINIGRSVCCESAYYIGAGVTEF